MFKNDLQANGSARSCNEKGYRVFIACWNPYIRIEFQDYLQSLLGEHVAFDACDLADIKDPSYLEDYQCILFSSRLVQQRFPLKIPESITQIVCTRTFNHAYLDQIIRIPSGEKVYVINDSLDPALDIIGQFQEFGITQYQFIPYAGDTRSIDLTVHYAITMGEPQLVPDHVPNIINIGNRIIDIATINELCVLFHLPAKIGNKITKNYISHIIKVVQAAGGHYSSFVTSQQLLLATISNLPLSICLLDKDGAILQVNRHFASDWGFSEKSALGKPLASFLPETDPPIAFDRTADHSVRTADGGLLLLRVLELSLPGRAHAFLLIGKRADPDSRDTDPSYHFSDPGTFSRYTSAKKASTEGSPVERQRNSFLDLITGDQRFRTVLAHAKRMSLYDFPVLIQGEEGTQKKMLARAIHESSARRDRPFISLNQMRVLSGLSFSEIIKEADHGTLLIDRIEHLSPDMQEALVQVLENISGPPMSAKQAHDIRIIATSCTDLYALVQEGDFRKDLFFQLSTAVLETIPLKDRREDIPLLLEHFFQNMFHDPKFHNEAVLSKSLYQFLLRYDYPGNVQELMNIAQHLFSMYAAHPLILAQLPAYIRRGLSLSENSQSVLKKEVLAILKNTPRAGRAAIQKALAGSGIQISDGRLRGLLKELAEDDLILIHRTKGGCEITEAGAAVLGGR